VGAGHAEHAWRQSAWLAALPVVSARGLLQGARRMVVVSPHPDDEVRGCGGLIHAARAAGIDVRLLAVTAGEACYPAHPRWTRDALRRMRASELHLALAQLGVAAEAITLLDIPDGAVAANEGALREAISARLLPGDHVFCTATWDGHPDHEATGRAARDAARQQQSRLSEFPVWAWHWSDPACPSPPRPGGVRCPLHSAARQAKQRAMACFVSQREGPGDRQPILPPHVIERFDRLYEVFFHDPR
jgi:LmbE family N-acetylglucosaminyl deacetylase